MRHHDLWKQLLIGAFMLSGLAGLKAAVVLTEDFEGTWSGGAPSGWSKESVSDNQNGRSVNWVKEQDGDDNHPPSAQSGTFFASFRDGDYDAQTRLISPNMDLSGYASAELTFQHFMEAWGSNQDTLRVQYRTSTGGSWTQLEYYNASVASWTERTLALPDLSSTYQIAFLGNAQYGYGVCVDAVQVNATAVPEPGETAAIAGFALLGFALIRRRFRPAAASVR